MSIKQIKRFGFVGFLSLAAGSAMAEVPAAVTTALGEAKTDSLTIGGLALVVIISIAAFKYMRRAV